MRREIRRWKRRRQCDEARRRWKRRRQCDEARRRWKRVKIGTKVEYMIWNPFRPKLAASIIAGVDNIWIKPGARVLYLGAASGTTVSHVSDLGWPTGVVDAIEFSHRSGRDLVNMAKKRTNVIPIIEDARHPAKYCMLVGMVDVIFSNIPCCFFL